MPTENLLGAQAERSGVRLVRASSRRFRRGARRGMTLIELLTVLLIMSLIIMGVYRVLYSSLQSYQDLWWQNQVNQQARQSLDELCDEVRAFGFGKDQLAPSTMDKTMVSNVSVDNLILSDQLGLGLAVTNLPNTIPGRQDYLIHYTGSNTSSTIGQYIKEVHFEYEYRKPFGDSAQLADPWQFQRVSNPFVVYNSDEAYYLINTVYITVVASVTPYAGAPTYTRSLTSAVQLRGAYNKVLPAAHQIP